MRLRRSLRVLMVAVAVALPAVAASLPTVAVAASAPLPVWGSVSTPNRGNLDNELLGLEVLAADDVWAVGDYNSGVAPTATGRRTLAQHWDGTRWRLVPTPDPSFSGLDFANLEEVSGTRSDDVWAVGHGDDFSTLRSRTVTEHWDGRSWSLVPSPNPAGPNQANRLFGVAAVATDNVWAVGEQGYPERALILHYDGRAWSPVANDCGLGLTAVTQVPGTQQLWAVGADAACLFTGRRWVRVDAPGAADLADVTVTPSGALWTVGSRTFCDSFSCHRSSVVQRLVSGRQLVDVEHPGVSALTGIHAVADDDIWAAGTNSLGTVIEHWDGRSWTVVPSPDPDRGGELNTMDGRPGAELWSTGYFYGANQRTLALQAPSPTQGQVIGHTNHGGATVAWYGPVTGSTVTESTGDFTIAGLPAGEYLVTITSPFIDNCTDSAEITVVANTTTTLDFFFPC